MDRQIINMIEQKIIDVDNIEMSNSNNKADAHLLYKLQFKIILQDLLKEYLDYCLPDYKLKQLAKIKRLTGELNEHMIDINFEGHSFRETGRFF